MNLIDYLPIAQVDTSYSETHERTYSSPFDAGYWFPEQASEFATRTDFLFMAISWISLVFFLIIMGVMIAFIIKYRRREGVAPEPSSSHNTSLEIFWSVIPSIILVWIFYVGASGYFDLKVATDDAEEIYVTASRWNWKFRYPNGDISDELHLVKDRPVKLIMQSTDVLHSMFVSAFRQKMDIVPGRYTYAYVNPTLVGKFRLACTEYCGTEHSRMRTLCQVHADNDARRTSTEWVRAAHKPWENGERLYKINCSGCHKIDGQAATGPALNLLWAKGEEDLMGGEKVKVDEEYIRESILYPEKKVVAGYGPISKMNSFEGKLTPDQIADLTIYIKYLSDPTTYDVDYSKGDDGTSLIIPSVSENGSPEASAESSETDESSTETETTGEDETSADEH
ncbi:MAG: cytochrome c oxidase subunit II [Planctomycetota bacterium]